MHLSTALLKHSLCNQVVFISFRIIICGPDSMLQLPPKKKSMLKNQWNTQRPGMKVIATAGVEATESSLPL